jgi:hypothetical protein
VKSIAYGAVDYADTVVIIYCLVRDKENKFMVAGTRPGMKVGEKEHHVQEDMLKVGDKAPDFKLTANDWTTKARELV